MRSYLRHCWESANLVEMLVLAAIIGTLVGLLWPAFHSAREAAKRREPGAPAQVEVESGYWHFKTVHHDRHWWVVSIRGDGDQFSHHPDCPCSQRTPEAK